MYCLAEINRLGSVPTIAPLRLRVRVHSVPSRDSDLSAESGAMLAVLASLLLHPFVTDASRGSVHVMARKKSMPVFLRLLLKFTIRLEKWAPD